MKTAALLALLVATAAYYVPIRFHSLMGDDFLPHLLIEHAQLHGLASVLFTRDTLGLFRPIGLLFVIERAKLFGAQYELYFYSNLLMVYATSGCLFLLLERRSRSVALAAVVSLFFVWHHYQYYPVLIRSGEVDVLPNLLFVGFVALLLRFLDRPEPRRMLATIGVYAALVYTRENYIFVGPVLALVAFWRAPGVERRQALRDRRAWGLAALVILVTLSYMVWRRVVLGPAMTSIPGAQLNFSPVSVLRSYGIFFLDLFAIYFNEGWFTGIEHARVAVGIKVLQVAFVAANALLFAAWFRSAQVTRREKEISLILAAIGLSMLVPGALIAKNDLRYISVSFTIYAVLLGTTIPAVQRSRTGLAAAVAGLLIYVTVTSFYFRRHIEELFYVEGSRICESLKAATIDQYGLSLRQYRLYIQRHQRLEWPLLGSTYFRVYLQDPKFETRYYDRLEEIDVRADKLLVLSFDPYSRSFDDVTELAREARTPRGPLHFDGVATFASGEIAPQTAAATPSGRGVFLTSPGGGDKSASGETTLTVLSGFQFRSPVLRVDRGDTLFVSYRAPLKESDGAGLRIRARSGAMVDVLLDDPTLLPSRSWTRRRVELSRLAGRSIRLEVEVYSPSGDATADWVAMKELVVLGPPPLAGESRPPR